MQPTFAVRLAAACAAVALTATAAPAAEARTGSRAGLDLPTTREVAQHFPVLRGGARDVYRTREVSVIGPSCVSYRSARVAPRAGRWASYVLRDGQSPYFAGHAAPGVFVYEYAGRRAAQRALLEHRRAFRRCDGPHFEDGSGKNYSPMRLPAIGEARTAARVVTSDRYTGRDWFIETWVRVGDRLVNVNVQKDAGAPASAPAIGLLRTAVRHAR